MVQEQLSKNKGASHTNKRQYLLSGLIKCGYCGGTYTGFATKIAEAAKKPFTIHVPQRTFENLQSQKCSW